MRSFGQVDLKAPARTSVRRSLEKSEARGVSEWRQLSRLAPSSAPSLTADTYVPRVRECWTVLTGMPAISAEHSGIVAAWASGTPGAGSA
jgi:hypothetical protein